MKALIVGALAAVVLSGCSTVAGGKLVDGVGGEPGKLVVVNEGERNVTGILLSRCDAFSTGFNRLARGEYLTTGKSHEFELSPGCWDLQVGGEGYQSSSQLEIKPGQRQSVKYK